MNQYYYHSGVNQMLADNFWQRWAEELRKDKNILEVPITFAPWQIEFTPPTSAVIISAASILAAGMIGAAIIKNR